MRTWRWTAGAHIQIGWSQTPKHYISWVLTIGQYELHGTKTRGGQSIVRARGHAVTRMGRGATRVDGADHGTRGGGGNRRKKISVLFSGYDVITYDVIIDREILAFLGVLWLVVDEHPLHPLHPRRGNYEWN